MQPYYRLHTDVTPPPACKHTDSPDKEISFFFRNSHSEFSVLCLYLKTIKQMRDEEATGDYGVPADVLGEDSFRLTTKLINNVYETTKWPKYITEVTTTLKEPEEPNFSDHPTISLSAHSRNRRNDTWKNV
jgi:hypothetical protein